MTGQTLVLVRHAQSQSNLMRLFVGRYDDPALTPKGIRQAYELAQNLAGIGFAGIISSPLTRARMTAEIIGDEINLPVEINSDICEVNLGELAGQSAERPDMHAVYDHLVANWEKGFHHAGILGGESLLDVKVRLNRFLQLLSEKKADRPVLVVGHSICWMCLIWLFCQNRPDKITNGYPRNVHITVVAQRPAGYSLEWNNIPPQEVRRLF